RTERRGRRAGRIAGAVCRLCGMAETVAEWGAAGAAAGGLERGAAAGSGGAGTGAGKGGGGEEHRRVGTTGKPERGGVEAGTDREAETDGAAAGQHVVHGAAGGIQRGGGRLRRAEGCGDRDADRQPEPGGNGRADRIFRQYAAGADRVERGMDVWRTGEGRETDRHRSVCASGRAV